MFSGFVCIHVGVSGGFCGSRGSVICWVFKEVFMIAVGLSYLTTTWRHNSLLWNI